MKEVKKVMEQKKEQEEDLTEGGHFRGGVSD